MNLQDAAAERAVLACALLDQDLAHRVIEDLDVADFFDTRNRNVRLGIERAMKDAGAVDLLTLAAGIGALGKEADLAYLATLDVDLPDISRFEVYVDQIRALTARRRLIAFSKQLDRWASDADMDLERIAHTASTTIADIVRTEPLSEFSTAHDMAAMVRAACDRTEDESWGVPTGIGCLDRKTRGFHPGQQIVLAARPGAGKTAFALNQALGAAKAGKRVAFFSFEMSTDDLALRVAAQLGGINFEALRRGGMRPDDIRSAVRAASEIEGLHLHACDRAQTTIAKLHTMCRRLQRSAGLDFVVVDYMQLVMPNDLRAPKVQQVTDISRDLKIMAMDLRVPVLALSQLNRKVEERPDKRPHLSDLRESGAIEQDADLVLFLYRDEMYNPDSDAKGIAELIIGKFRNGQTQTLLLGFDGPTMTFGELGFEELPL